MVKIWTTLVVATLMAPAAPFAHADPAEDQSAYLHDLRNDGVVPDSQATAAALIQLGYATCRARAKGMSDSQIVDSITGGSVTHEKAKWIMLDAGMNLC